MVNVRFNTSKATTEINEYYPTPPEFTKALLKHSNPPKHIWECAAGTGDMSAVLEAHGCIVTSTDITTGTDFLTVRTLPTQEIGGIVTNPPFSKSLEFIKHALELVPYVAMLQPIYYLGGSKRYDELWKVTPPQLCVVVADRMKLGTKTSHFNHIWCVWDRRAAAETRMVWVRL